MWVPDVYEGAATPVTLFIGTVPKIAAFGMLMRALVEGLGALQADWSQMLVVLAVLSMGAGNVIALAQTNVKRMLAYSTIAHVGFIFVGVVSGTAAGYAASMFYVLTYALTALGGFAMVIWLESAGELLAEQVRDIGSIVVGVVCCRSNIQIKQHLAAGLQLNESHVAVADRKERKRAGHGVISVGIRSHDMFAHHINRGKF